MQPLRVLTCGQSRERPRLHDTPNNDVRTDTYTTPGHRRAGACANDEVREQRKSLWNKAYPEVWPNAGHNIWPIQVGPVSGQKARSHWLFGVRRAKIQLRNLPPKMGRPLGRPFPFQERNMTNPKTAAEILYGSSKI